MTVEDLVELLDKYPGDMVVTICTDYYPYLHSVTGVCLSKDGNKVEIEAD